MAEIERKELRVSEQFDLDILSVYSFGEEIFGQSAAKSFIADVYSKVWSLDSNYLFTCSVSSFVNKRQALSKYHSGFLSYYLQDS